MNTPRWITYFKPDSWMTQSERRFHWTLLICLSVIFLNALFQVVVEVITWGQPFPS